MTRARCFALAVLVGVCCLGQAAAYAQSGPPVPMSGSPGPYYFDPNGGSPAGAGPAPAPWYGDPDEVAASNNRYGPLVVSNGWFLRAEYLNYNIANPGHSLLGAPVSAISKPPPLGGLYVAPVGSPPGTLATAISPPSPGDPSQPFLVFPPGSSTPIAVTQVPTTNSMNLGSIPGVQVTAGIDLISGGSFEVSAFMLAKKSSGFRLGNFGTTTIPFDTDADGVILPNFLEPTEVLTLPNTVGTSVLVNGQVSNQVLLYNVGYQAIFTSQLWGGEANYFYDLDAVGIFQIKPLVGVRYMNLSERLNQQGVFQNFLVSGPTVVSTIDSSTMNNLWGPQIGFRAQFVTPWLEFGVNPKLLMLGNSMLSQVTTNHLRSNADPIVSTNDMTTQFTFGTDVGGFATINLSKSFSIRGGYNFIWVNRVTRPHNNIYYNDNGPGSPPGIIDKPTTHDIIITGASVGCEFRF